jgi:hypothetical protein
MLRAIAKVLCLGVLAFGGSVGMYLIFSHDAARQAVAELEKKNQELQQIRLRLETDRRIAKVLVTDQKTVDGKLKTTFVFSEYARDGTALPAKQFTIDGNEAHFDAQVVNFKDEYVEQGDPFRGQSILLFQRVYGSDQAPDDGIPIDQAGTVPEIYRGWDPQSSAFELDIWKNFWKLYNDEEAREAKGIRGLDGEGLYGQLEPGHIYTITLRATGDGTIHEEPVEPIYKQSVGNAAGN